MEIVEILGIILTLCGIVYIFLQGRGILSSNGENIIDTKILILKGGAGLILVFLGIFAVGGGAGGLTKVLSEAGINLAPVDSAASSVLTTSPTLSPTPSPTQTIPTPTPTSSGIVNIPLSAEWQVDPSETGGVGVEYKNGILELKTRLQGGNNAQFSLVLSRVYIPEIERNSDGTYNLSGTELIAVVKSNRNFEGRLALFNKSWDFLKGPWLDRIDATNGQMFFKVPNDINHSKINAISFVFAIQPNETYEGSFFIQSLILKK